jgi:hypothetical protein
LVTHTQHVLLVNKGFASAELGEEPVFETCVRRSVPFAGVVDDGLDITAADVSPVATRPFDIAPDPEGVH